MPNLFVVDVEADGPIPGDYNMLSFAAVRVEHGLTTVFASGPLYAPSNAFVPEALFSIGYTMDTYKDAHKHGGVDPKIAMENFETWVLKLSTGGRPIFMSDNNGFDWMFICWYFHHYLGRNPFGYSSRRIGDLYCGLVKDMRAPWKHLRTTKHTHNPVDDARGNAEALLHMINNMGLK